MAFPRYKFPREFAEIIKAKTKKIVLIINRLITYVIKCNLL
jgi:hypothetical protein